MRTTADIPVPAGGTRITGIAVEPGLFFDFYQLGPCEGAEPPEPEPEPTLRLCITLCVDDDASRGERAIRVSTITGADDELVGVGAFVVLDRYGSEPGGCSEP